MEDLRNNRQYKTNPLPVLLDGEQLPENRELLLNLYNEIGVTWRALVDVRFKLLALVPFASLAALAVGANLSGSVQVDVLRFIFSAVGLAITLGLLIYDRRNSELHNDLISRGRRIEAALGVDTAVYRGRLLPRSWLVQHGTATNMIYGSSLVAWLSLVVLSIPRLVTIF